MWANSRTSRTCRPSAARRKVLGAEVLEPRTLLAACGQQAALSVFTTSPPRVGQGVQVEVQAVSETGQAGTYDFRIRGSETEWQTVQRSSEDRFLWDTSDWASDVYYVGAGLATPECQHAVVFAKPIEVVLTDLAPATAAVVAADSSRVQPNDVVEFRAAAVGSDVEFRYTMSAPGSDWVVARGYSPDPDWRWDTAHAPPGEYHVGVEVRTSGSPALVEAYAKPVRIVLTEVPAATGVSLTADLTAPAAGETVTFRAAGQGGNGQYEYQFRARSDTTEWAVVREFSDDPEWTWSPAVTDRGNRFVDVLVRSLGSPASFEAHGKPIVVSLDRVAPAVSFSLLADASERVASGRSVRLTGVANGTSAPFEFAYTLRSPTTEWRVVRDFSASPHWTWDAANYPSGTYYIGLFVRRAGRQEGYDAAVKPLRFVVTDVPATVTVSLQSTTARRIVPGTFVVFSAAGEGGIGEYEYRFRLGSSRLEWHTVRDYEVNSEWTWDTAEYPEDEYFIQVQARSQGSPADWEAQSGSVSHVLTSAVPATGVQASVAEDRVYRVGDGVSFSASGEGGAGVYEYRYRARIDGIWKTLRDFSVDSDWTWETAELDAGQYFVEAGVRAAGSPDGPEAVRVVALTVRSNVEQLWQQGLSPYLSSPLWEATFVEDAAHTLQVPLQAAFLGDRPEWREEFAAHFARFVESGYQIESELWRREYFYLASRFVALAAQIGQQHLVPEGLVVILTSELEQAWVGSPAWMWDSPSFVGGVRERVLWKIETREPGFGYYRAIVDHTAFLIGIAAELRKFERLSGERLPQSELIDDVLDVTRRMYDEFVVHLPHGGWLFQPGVWSDHPQFAFAGHAVLAPALPPAPLEDVAEDSSHAIRRPLWLVSLAEAYPAGSPSRAYYLDLLEGLETQFMERVLVRPDDDSSVYRTNNYMDGRNTIYRYGYYTAGANLGYGPYQLSGTVYYGWWAFLNTERVRDIYRYMSHQWPLDEATLATFVGPNTNRERHAFELLPDSFTNGNKELMTLLAAELPVQVER